MTYKGMALASIGFIIKTRDFRISHMYCTRNKETTGESLKLTFLYNAQNSDILHNEKL